jgi:ribosomal subunit interface protein
MLDIKYTQKHFELDPKLQKYIDKHLGKLDKYLNKKSRVGLAPTLLLEGLAKKSDQGHQLFYAEFLVDLHKDHKIVAHASALNMYAAIDMVSAKALSQIHKIHDKKIGQRKTIRLKLSRLRAKF